jgi:hypothetical protein
VARAEWPRLPALEGELAGRFMIAMLPAAPSFEWKITVRGIEGGRRRVELTANAVGAHLQAHADFDPATGDGQWRIDAGEIDAAAWFPAVVAKIGEALSGAELRGKISVTGEGALKAGVPGGSAVLTLAEGRFAFAKSKLEFTGLALRVTLARLPDAAGEGEITFTEAQAAGVTLREGRVAFALSEDGVVQITDTRVRGLGGALTATPFQFKFSQPEIAVTLSLVGISLEEVVALLPSALSEAHGHVDGQITLNWSETAGLGFGAGWLRLADKADATVRLTPTPGLITAQLSAGNPAFASLQRVELGKTPLSVHLLSAEFSPAGDGLGRTASVRLEAQPIDPQLIAPLVLDVNVAGPLDQLIKLGLNDRVKMGGPH